MTLIVMTSCNNSDKKTESENKSVKLVYCIRKNPSMTKQEFHKYWREDHEKLVKSFVKALNADKYVQSHTMDIPLNEAIMNGRGMLGEPYDGITEIWWESIDKLLETLNMEEFQKASEKFIADEAIFIDLKNSCAFMTEENIAFDFSGKKD